MTFVLVLLLSMIYASIVGGTYMGLNNAARNRCLRCKDGGTCYVDHEVGAFFAAVLWPVGLPCAFGYSLMDRDGKETNRREKEIADAKHKVELARLSRQESEELDRQLGIVKEPVMLSPTVGRKAPKTSKWSRG